MTCLFKNVSKQFEKLKSQIGIENCKINLNRDIKDIKTNVVENFDCDLEFLKEDLIKQKNTCRNIIESIKQMSKDVEFEKLE